MDRSVVSSQFPFLHGGRARIQVPGKQCLVYFTTPPQLLAKRGFDRVKWIKDPICGVNFSDVTARRKIREGSSLVGTYGDLEKCRPWHFSPRKSEKRGFRFPSFSITCRDLKWRHIPVPRGHLDFSRRPYTDLRADRSIPGFDRLRCRDTLKPDYVA